MSPIVPPPLQPIAITPGFFVSGQVFSKYFANLRKMGFTRILNVRPDGEEDGQEQPPSYLLEPMAIKAGLKFSQIPITTGAEFSESSIRAMAHLLSEEPQKTLGFCTTGIRSLRLWALGSALAGTASPQQIFAAAEKAGFDLSSFSHHLTRLARKETPIYVTDNTANII